jgi:phosphoglycolate phosphatase-like HAD superfamily hydrolase
MRTSPTLPPRGVVMVGDRTSDVEAARAVGCHFVGCDYGHGYRHEIEAAGPLVNRFSDLPRAIAGVLAD